MHDNSLTLNSDELELIAMSSAQKPPECTLAVQQRVIPSSATATCLGFFWSHNLSPKAAIENNINECTKVQNPRRTRVSESLKAHALLKRTLITFDGKYTEDLRGKTETKEKEACCLTSNRIPGNV